VQATLREYRPKLQWMVPRDNLSGSSGDLLDRFQPRDNTIRPRLSRPAHAEAATWPAYTARGTAPREGKLQHALGPVRATPERGLPRQRVLVAHHLGLVKMRSTTKSRDVG